MHLRLEIHKPLPEMSSLLCVLPPSPNRDGGGARAAERLLPLGKTTPQSVKMGAIGCEQSCSTWECE